MTDRLARHYILLHPEDCDPPHGLDLTAGSRDLVKVMKLAEAFSKDGWDPNEPAAVGYPLNGRVQLVSATHRHEAAKRAGILIPVHMALRSVVEGAWGTPKWTAFIQDIAVKDLELVVVSAPVPPPGLDERVDLARDV